MSGMIPDVLTIDDLQSVLHISRSLAYKLVKDKKIESIRVGRLIRIPKIFLIDYLESTRNTIHSSGRKNVSALSELGGIYDSESAG